MRIQFKNNHTSRFQSKKLCGVLGKGFAEESNTKFQKKMHHNNKFVIIFQEDFVMISWEEVRKELNTTTEEEVCIRKVY